MKEEKRGKPETSQLSWRKIVSAALKTLIRALPAILLFELMYKGLTMILFQPLLSLVLQSALRISGQGPVLNEAILSFFTSPPGIVAAILLTVISCLLIYFEFSVIILLVWQAFQRKPVRLIQAIHLSFTTFRSLKSFSTPGFALYVLLILPLVNLGLTSSLMPTLRIPAFITGELTKTCFGNFLLLLFAALILLLFLCFAFVMPIMVLSGCSFGKAAKRGAGILKQVAVKSLLPLLLVLLAWGVALLIPVLVLLLGFDLDTVEASVILEAIAGYGLSWRSVVILICALLTALQKLTLMPLVLTFISILYLTVDGQADLRTDAIPKVKAGIGGLRERIKKHGLILAAGFVLLGSRIRGSLLFQQHKKKLTALTAAALLLSAGVLYFGVDPEMPPPAVLGHRGSLTGVENTLEAVQGAINAGADYVEIDILLSKDGVPMVIHDTSLYRLSGKRESVYNLTAAELKQIELSQNGLTGYISTLEEMIRYCKGKIDLDIELKLHGQETKDILREAMRIIERLEFQDHCIFHTTEYELTQRLKAGWPDFSVGYVIYGNVGNMSRGDLEALNVDFLSLEESVISPALIRRCNRAGLPVYVWTVNDPERMSWLWEIGVGGIITDLPEPAAASLKAWLDGAPGA